MRRELPLAGVALAALCALVFGAHLQPGGFYNDDWNYLVPARFSGSFFDAVGAFDTVFGPSYQPLMRVYWPATFALLGVEPTRHIVWLLVLGTAMTVMLYALLRRVGVGPGHAGAISAIVLVLADADSARLWPCISANVLSLMLFASGVVVSLWALRRRGARALAGHALGLVLIVASLTLYVITVGLALTAGILYVLRAGRRGAVRWAADVAVTVTVALLITGQRGYDPLPLGEYPRRVVEVGKDAAWVLADGLWAPAYPSRAVVVVVWLALGTILCAGWWRLRRGSLDQATAAELRRWLTLAAGAAVAAIAAYAAILPSSYLSPQGPGQLNRVNVAGGVALVMLTYAGLMVAALLATARTGRSPRWAGALVGAAALVIAIGNVTQARRDQRAWEHAAVLQREVVAAVARTVGRVPEEALVITYSAPFYSAPEVPVFAYPWDLSGALAVHYDDATIRGFPALGRPQLTCDAGSLTIVRQGEPFAPVTAQYGRAYVVAVDRRRAIAVTDARTCRRASEAVTG